VRRDIRTLKKIVASESVSQWFSETAKIKDGLIDNIYLGNLCGEKERKNKKRERRKKRERQKEKERRERVKEKRERESKLNFI